MNKHNLTLLPAIALSCIAGKLLAQQHQRPNILWIMSDDHSYQTISAYGSEVSKLAPTPNIDRIAKEGVRFDRAFVENSLSTPSRACLITGLYSHQNGQRRLGKGIDSTKTFVSELLQNAGYQTGVVGKWHMQCEPKGFDFYRIFRGQGEYYNPVFKSHDSNGQYLQEQGYATELTTEHAVEFLNQRDTNKPFFLMVHHKAPHRNWMPDLKYVGLYDHIQFPLPKTFWDDYDSRGVAAHHQDMNIANTMRLANDNKVFELLDTTQRRRTDFLSAFSPAQRKQWEAYYKKRNKEFLDAQLSDSALTVWKYQRYLHDYMEVIHSVDQGVGDLLEYLERNNLLENTIVVYASDQGFYMGEHGWFDKRFIYEESFRTPLVIRYPKRIKPGTVDTHLVQNIDFAPTFLDIAGVKKPDYMTGRSIFELFAEKPVKNWRTSLYYHYYDYPAEHRVRRHDGVRTKRYKLVHFYGPGLSIADEWQSNRGDRPARAGNRAFNEDDYLKALREREGNRKDPDVNYSELYDLQNDPNELHNLYGQPGYEKITKELQKTLDKYRKDLKVDEF